MVGAISLEEIEILPNGISRTPVPVEAYPLLGRHGFQEVPYLPAKNAPPFFKMIIQGLRLILGKDDKPV